ncbi:hypothetical protein [Clostridium hydrogenum]|uniref:hypothetical protein n=1 Tax=Clostridium hydrogenum TaxID=2855764 RepID=UPI001F3E2F64|nr:hypothetical protein [Clostridium hydrogenum]
MSVDIDKLKQLALIKYCIKNNLYPVIIHTHVGNRKKLEFSHGDREFELAFIKACSILGYKNISIWIVYSKVGYSARIYKKNKYKYVTIEHKNPIKCFKHSNLFVKIEILLYFIGFILSKVKTYSTIKDT